jgi:hypothetical protein
MGFSLSLFWGVVFCVSRFLGFSVSFIAGRRQRLLPSSFGYLRLELVLGGLCPAKDSPNPQSGLRGGGGRDVLRPPSPQYAPLKNPPPVEKVSDFFS